MGKNIKRRIAIVLITVLMLTNVSVLFPLFSLFGNTVEAAVLTQPQIASFENQKWLIDEIIRQVRLTRPTVSNISQVTTEELETITIISMDNVATPGETATSNGHIPSGIGLLTNLTNLSIVGTAQNPDTPVLTGRIPSEIRKFN